MDILDLFFILEKKLSVFEYDVSCGLVICSLYYADVHSLYAHSVVSFIFIKYSVVTLINNITYVLGVQLCWEFLLWILSNVFICFYWDNHMIFTLYFVIVLYYIDFFEYVEPFLYPWNKPHDIWFFFVLLSSVC